MTETRPRTTEQAAIDRVAAQLREQLEHLPPRPPRQRVTVHYACGHSASFVERTHDGGARRVVQRCPVCVLTGGGKERG